MLGENEVLLLKEGEIGILFALSGKDKNHEIEITPMFQNALKAVAPKIGRVEYHIKNLERMGLVERGQGGNRYKLTELGREVISSVHSKEFGNVWVALELPRNVVDKIREAMRTRNNHKIKFSNSVASFVASILKPIYDAGGEIDTHILEKKFPEKQLFLTLFMFERMGLLFLKIENNKIKRVTLTPQGREILLQITAEDTKQDIIEVVVSSETHLIISTNVEMLRRTGLARELGMESIIEGITF